MLLCGAFWHSFLLPEALAVFLPLAGFEIRQRPAGNGFGEGGDAGVADLVFVEKQLLEVRQGPPWQSF